MWCAPTEKRLIPCPAIAPHQDEEAIGGIWLLNRFKSTMITVRLGHPPVAGWDGRCRWSQGRIYPHLKSGDYYTENVIVSHIYKMREACTGPVNALKSGNKQISPPP
jgi:hypothetical protein